MIRLDVFGWFQDCGDKPTHDPGIFDGICPACGSKIGGPGRSRAVSLMHEGGTRSYFFRVHKACWDELDEEKRNSIESSLIDSLSPEER